MLDSEQTKKIKKAVEDFFDKMTIAVSSVEVSSSVSQKGLKGFIDLSGENMDVVDLDVKTEEPQILIGQQGQTLLEIQRLLKTLLNKKLQKVFYLNLDINDYKGKKIEYLKHLAKDVADQVSFTKNEKELSPMSSYERRIIHAELADRDDILTESRGEGFDRHIVVKPK